MVLHPKQCDVCYFQPHILLQSFAMKLKGKIISIDIEVVDAPLDYNLLLVHSFFYVNIIVTSSFVCILQFHHQGKIVIVDQIDYCTPDIHNSTMNNVPFLGSVLGYESVGLGLLKDSSLMGIFNFPPPDTP